MDNKPVVKVTFFENGQQKSEVYLTPQRAERAITAWQSRGQDHTAKEQLVSK